MTAENTARFGGGKLLKNSYAELIKQSNLSIIAVEPEPELKEKPEETVARILGALTSRGE